MVKPLKRGANGRIAEMTDGDLIEGGLITSNPRAVIEDVTCDSGVIVGDWLKMTSGGTAIKAQADSSSNSNVIGLCISKSEPTKCNIRFNGVSEAIFSSLDLTKSYRLSPNVAGAMQTGVVTTSGQVDLVLGKPFSTTEFFVNIEEGVIRT